MAWNGSGQFTRTDGTRSGSTVWQQARDAAIDIVADGHDAHDEDIAAGLENCMTLDGQTTPTADLPMGGFKFLNVDDAAARTQFARADQVQDSTLVWLGTTSGTNTITATATPAITAYVAGQRFAFKAGGATTGAATLNINGVGAANLIKGTGTAMATGDIVANALYEVMYGGSDFVLLNSSAPRFFGDATFPTAGTGPIISVGTLTATGSDQGGAAAVVSRITNVNAGSGGVVLPATPTAGASYYIHTTVALNVYPGSGDQINALTANIPFVLPANTGMLFTALSTSLWSTSSRIAGAVQDYTVTNMGSSLRTIDFVSSDDDDVREVLSTLISDLIANGVLS